MSLRAFRRIVAVVWFALVVGVFVLSEAPIWMAVVMGLLASGGYMGMTARARAAGWFGPPELEEQPVKLLPVALGVLFMLVAMALLYLFVFAVFG